MSLPTVWRVGWPSRIVPPRKVGRWWVYVGPYLVGWPGGAW